MRDDELVHRRVFDAPRELVFDEPATGIRTTVALGPAGDGTLLRGLPVRTRLPEIVGANAVIGIVGEGIG